MTESDFAAQIEAFVRESFAVSESDPRFGREVDLFDQGYVDSVGLIELLAFIEDELGLEVPDEELAADEFMTIAGIARVLARLRAAQTEPTAERAPQSSTSGQGSFAEAGPTDR